MYVTILFCQGVGGLNQTEALNGLNSFTIYLLVAFYSNYLQNFKIPAAQKDKAFHKYGKSPYI